MKQGDVLVAINGENIEQETQRVVEQKLDLARFPRPLSILVAAPITYDAYIRDNMSIHSDDEYIVELPPNAIDTTISTGRSSTYCQVNQIPLIALAKR